MKKIILTHSNWIPVIGIPITLYFGSTEYKALDERKPLDFWGSALFQGITTGLLICSPF